MELNKFQIIVIVVVMMFVFIVGVLYTNTKEAADSKMAKKTVTNEQQEQQSTTQIVTTDDTKLNDLYSTVSSLSYKVSNLESQVQSIANQSSGPKVNLRCKVQGIMESGGNIVPMSESEAFKELNSGSDLVISCRR